MPKSTRAKVISLTKTVKKTRSDNAAHMERVREAANEHAHAFVFSIGGMRNAFLKEARDLWKGSRMFFGKNRVTARALGETEEEECATGIRGVSKLLSGPVGILFTDEEPAAVIEWFATYSRSDYARAGNRASQDVILPVGPLFMRSNPPENLPHPLEPQLRKLGLPTELKRGVPTMLREYTVVKKGQVLTSDAAQILKHLLIQDATFRIVPLAHWNSETGATEVLALTPEQKAIVGDLHMGKKVKSQSKARPKGSLPEKSAAGADDDEEMGEDDEEEDDDEDDDDEEMENEDKVDDSMMLPAGFKA